MQHLENKLIVERIAEFAQSENLSIRQLEANVGLNEGLIKALKNKGSSIGSDKLVKILNQYPKINANWLLTGEGEMLLNTIEPRTDCTNNAVNHDAIIVAMNTQLNTLTHKVEEDNKEIEALKKQLMEKEIQIKTLTELIKNLKL